MRLTIFDLEAYARRRMSDGSPLMPMYTDYQKEIAKGRIPLWLDLDDMRFLACEYSRLPDDAPDELTRVWMRIAARAHAALTKSGREALPFQPVADGED